MAQPPSVLLVLLFVIVLLFVHPPSVLLVLLFVIVLLFVHPDCITICSSAQRASGVAASSSSFAPFDVFINHRGPDVKNTLASLLYHELKSRGLQVFLDRPELEPGHSINSQIKAAIEGASVHVAIFSPKYAESKWCLDELVQMIDSTGKILPVFYKVKPSELRRTDKGAYADALRKHEEQQRHDFQTIVEWKKALSHVADISGFELDACNGDEVELVDKVVQRVFKEVPKPPLHVAKYQIGLQEKLEDFERKVLSQLEEEGRQEAKVVGIVGLGGIGKSTLARDFFNRKRSNYRHSSFLADVRENEARKSITSLQSQLIKDLGGRDISIRSRDEGIGELEKNLKSCHSLIILDDVDHLHQLDALILPIRYVLDPKSLILITSRDKHLLRSARITDSSIYQLKGLDTPHSLELFCCHAFFHPHPLPQFEDLVDGFVKACHGLPLSLQVFGALLCEENDTSYWEEQLNELQSLPPEIEVRLKISYDSLNKQEKQIFLDIACFSIGHDKDKWIRIWGGSRWKGSVGLRNLENKCLIEVDAENKIRMHDHLRDMGRNIAAEDLSMPRRIWGAATVKDVYDLLEQSLSSKQKVEVRGIIMPRQWDRFTNAWKEGSFTDEVFRRISKLELLVAAEDFVEGILSKVRAPNLNLLWLCCTSCDSSSLPSCIPMGDLRVLEVSGAYKLKMLPDFSENLLNIQEINLADCESLEVLPDSIANLRRVQKINLKGCEKLKMLPDFSENLLNIQEINLAGCECLEVLPDSIGNLTNVQMIHLEGCTSLEVLPNALGNLTNLREINLEGCTSLEVLPNAFGTLTNLREINLAGCEKLKMLPDFSENLLNIQQINLGGCESLEVLPDSIQNLRSLQQINLKGCQSLEVLPNSIENLTNLQRINLENCKSLKVLPNSIENLINLRAINLEGCECLELLPNSFGNLTNLEFIDASHSFNLQMPSDPLGNLLQLKHLHLRGCSSLTISNETLGNITMLECLDLSRCLQLEVLPLQVLHQSFLRRLNLLSTNIKELPSVPTVCLSNLEELILGSPLLKVLPPWLGCLKSLRKLLLHGCRKLKCLPDSVGQLSQMRVLEISKCGIQYLPAAVMQLNNLKILRVRGCPLRELTFKRVEGDGEPSLLTESSEGRGLDSSIHTGLMDLEELHLYLTDILEVSFPEGVCPNLQKLKIRWCNDLVEVGALPTTLVSLDLRGCGALRKIGLAGLSKLEKLDMRGCCAVEVEELPGLETVICSDILRRILRSLRILKTPFETYYPGEVDKDVRAMAALQAGRLQLCYLCPSWSWFWSWSWY